MSPFMSQTGSVAVMTNGKWPIVSRRPCGEWPVVYVLLADDGKPLYVGTSDTLITRLQSHRQQKPWFSEVAYVTWHTAPDRRLDRYEWERTAIISLCGKYNRERGADHLSAMNFAEVRDHRIWKAIVNERPMSLALSFDMWVEDVFRRALIGSRWRLMQVEPALPIWRWAAMAA